MTLLNLKANSAWTEALEKLYETFADYPRFVGYIGCTHCVSESEQDVIRPVPLRALSEEQLLPVAFNIGVGTFGDISDYKHFLPRLFEVIPPHWSFSCVLSGLQSFDLPAWPQHERVAVEDILSVWLIEEIGSAAKEYHDHTGYRLWEIIAAFSSHERAMAVLRDSSDSIFGTLALLAKDAAESDTVALQTFRALATPGDIARLQRLVSEPNMPDYFEWSIPDLLAELEAL